VSSTLTTKTTSAASEATIGTRIPFGSAGGSITVTAVETDVDAGRLFIPPRGRRFFAAQVKSCAGPAEHGLSFAPDYFSVQLADHSTYPGAEGAKQPALPPSVLPPGGCLDGWVTFTIPKNPAPLTVVYNGSRQATWSLPHPSTTRQ
jgi:hypothetical protein